MLYKTKAQHDAVYNSAEYAEPWVGYELQNFNVSYNKKAVKRHVILTSASAEKPYDGEDLANDEIYISGDGFADGEGASYNVTGSQRLVGSSANQFTYTLIPGTNQDDYDIDIVFGTLTVTDEDVADDNVVSLNIESQTNTNATLTLYIRNIYNEQKNISVIVSDNSVITGVVPDSLSAGQVIDIEVTANLHAGNNLIQANITLGELEKEASETISVMSV